MAPKHHIEPLISEEQIQNRITQLATQIAHDYRGQELMLIGVLDGGVMATVDLGRALWVAGLKNICQDYIGISSYGNLLESTGTIRFTKQMQYSPKGRHVLVVEDIVDTGRTLMAVHGQINTHNPKSVASFAILSKPSRREVEVKLDYIGFEIPNKFVVGYGLNYEEMYRTMPDIGVVVFEDEHKGGK